MHTALECEVTIKPRFVYIPSPRTGPKRCGYCESRDGGGGGWGGAIRKGDWNLGVVAASLGDPGAGVPAAAAVRGSGEAGARRVGLRVGRGVSSCALSAAAGLAAGQPPPRVQHRAPDLVSCAVWGAARGESDRRAGGGG